MGTPLPAAALLLLAASGAWAEAGPRLRTPDFMKVQDSADEVCSDERTANAIRRPPGHMGREGQRIAAERCDRMVILRFDDAVVVYHDQGERGGIRQEGLTPFYGREIDCVLAMARRNSRKHLFEFRGRQQDYLGRDFELGRQSLGKVPPYHPPTNQCPHTS